LSSRLVIGAQVGNFISYMHLFEMENRILEMENKIL